MCVCCSCRLRNETFVVDTLAIEQLDPLKTIFADSKREVLFHNADYDLRLLNRDFGLRIGNLFDTKIASQFLGEPAIGLGALVRSTSGSRSTRTSARRLGTATAAARVARVCSGRRGTSARAARSSPRIVGSGRTAALGRRRVYTDAAHALEQRGHRWQWLFEGEGRP